MGGVFIWENGMGLLKGLSRLARGIGEDVFMAAPEAAAGGVLGTLGGALGGDISGVGMGEGALAGGAMGAAIGARRLPRDMLASIARALKQAHPDAPDDQIIQSAMEIIQRRGEDGRMQNYLAPKQRD